MQHTLVIHHLPQSEQVGFKGFQAAYHLTNAGDGEPTFILKCRWVLEGNRGLCTQIATDPDATSETSQTEC